MSACAEIGAADDREGGELERRVGGDRLEQPCAVGGEGDASGRRVEPGERAYDDVERGADFRPQTDQQGREQNGAGEA